MEATLFTGPVPGSAGIAFSGEMDLYNYQLFNEKVSEQLAANPNALMIDMQQITYLDSSGVGCIIRLVQTCKERKVKLLFCGLHGMPLRVLFMCNIAPLLQLFADRTEAMQSLAGMTAGMKGLGA